MLEAVELLQQQWREHGKGESKQVRDEQRSKEGRRVRQGQSFYYFILKNLLVLVHLSWIKKAEK
jgi:hypothetical protein